MKDQPGGFDELKGGIQGKNMYPVIEREDVI